MGIDDFLQHITGKITRIRMKSRGEKIRKGHPVLTIIQNGKQLNIHAPVSGTIKEQNKALSKNPSKVNESPYTDGWVYVIEPTNWLKESEFLIMWEKYKEWLKGEFSRLKDFVALSIKPNAAYAHLLQDGGAPKDGILENLGPEVWEDFQTNFLDQPA
jgi:glycine cleavage system H lipoate-binding protein